MAKSVKSAVKSALKPVAEKAKKVTKRSLMIDIMNANTDKSYEEVSALIAQNVPGFTLAAARQAYRFLAKNGFATGETGAVTRAKTTKAPKAAKAPKSTLSADAKKDRLALIKEVGARRKAEGLDRSFDGKRGRPMTDDEAAVAKEEITEMMNDLDSFKAPKFLTKAQVRALV